MDRQTFTTKEDKLVELSDSDTFIHSHSQDDQDDKVMMRVPTCDVLLSEWVGTLHLLL